MTVSTGPARRVPLGLRARVLAIRWAFARGAREVSAVLAPLVPPDVTARLDEVVDATDPDGRVDVFWPSGVDGTAQRLPTVVWVHGGGWVSGSKSDVAEYGRILASRGFTVVAVGYSIAPESRYPQPVRQTGAALRHVLAHADEYHVDPGRVALAGDSAGAQIAAQVAALVTDAGYAARVGVDAPLTPEQLRAAVLFCGAYDLSLPRTSRLGGMFLSTVLQSYSGTRHYAADPDLAYASVVDHVTDRFPPAFVSAGNADPLLAHSRSLVEALSRRAVDVETLFFADDHEPALGHEYQFRLDTDPGREAFERAVEFLRRRLG